MRSELPFSIACRNWSAKPAAGATGLGYVVRGHVSRME